MATVGEIRTALVDTVTAAIPGLFGYDTVADVVQVPCVVVRPEKAEYVVGMGACQQWEFCLFVLVGRTETNLNQNQLDTYVSASGAKSIPAAIRADPTLGLSGVDAVVTKMSTYGGHWDAAKVPHIGAQLHVQVLVTE